MKEIKAILKPEMLGTVLWALRNIEGLPGITISEVRGFGKTRKAVLARAAGLDILEYDKRIKLEIVVPDQLEEITIKTIAENARTGSRGDGKIFVSEVLDTIKVRTGERGPDAI